MNGWKRVELGLRNGRVLSTWPGNQRQRVGHGSKRDERKRNHEIGGNRDLVRHVRDPLNLKPRPPIVTCDGSC